ncbi:UNVERIFIED_CONTAM: hypothetical protein Slati_1053900 [Sesamum latifolium]|uniref:Uncharacterized protein n=1 Tax=Sesamum latifolium TaxID=2727402 RepID=A0AAW2XSY4_9LAMI
MNRGSGIRWIRGVGIMGRSRAWVWMEDRGSRSIQARGKLTKDKRTPTSTETVSIGLKGLKELNTGRRGRDVTPVPIPVERTLLFEEPELAAMGQRVGLPGSTKPS